MGASYDAASRQYPFAVLEMYQDKTFIDRAGDARQGGRPDRPVGTTLL